MNIKCVCIQFLFLILWDRPFPKINSLFELQVIIDLEYRHFGQVQIEATVKVIYPKYSKH